MLISLLNNIKQCKNDFQKLNIPTKNMKLISTIKFNMADYYLGKIATNFETVKKCFTQNIDVFSVFKIDQTESILTFCVIMML